MRHEPSAPVDSYRSVCMLLAVAALEGLVLRQFDVRTAFLNKELEQEVFIRAPACAEHLVGARVGVLQLRCALYGLCALWAVPSAGGMDQAPEG
jgi:hypothetical protein